MSKQIIFIVVLSVKYGVKHSVVHRAMVLLLAIQNDPLKKSQIAIISMLILL